MKSTCLRLLCLAMLVGCGGGGSTQGDEPEGTEAAIPEGTEQAAVLGREDCDGSRERFAWCEGQSTYYCYCRTPDTCTIGNSTCPWVNGSPLEGDTGSWCCTECEGIVDGVAEWDVCS
jgi:hypothetical protein